MTPRRWTVVAVVASLLMWACAVLAAPSGCAEARRLLQARALEPAETTALACVARAPADVAGWAVLAQVLAARGRYDQALAWYGRVLARFPGDREVQAARARTLAWSGRLDEAWQELQAMERAAPASDAELELFAANLALWRADFPEAERRYDRILARWPGEREALRGRGITRKTVGDLDGAHADWSALCGQEPGGDGCTEADELAARKSWLRLRLGYARTVASTTGASGSGGGAGWTLPVSADARLGDRLRASLGLEHRVRDFGGGAVGDIFIEGALSARLGARWALLAGAGATAGRVFSPRWLAYLEPSAGVGGGAELFLRYTRYDFPSAGAHVLSPALRWEPSAWVAQARYFLSWPDGEGARHAAVGRLSRTVARDWSLSVGGGAGVGLDHLELREGARGRFWNVLAAVSRRLSWRHQLALEYGYRREQADVARHGQHWLTMTGESRF